MPAIHINIWAVLVAAVATFMLGGLWYSPLLFAKQWVASHGYTPEQLEAMKGTAAKAYGLSFLCWLVMALMLAVLIGRFGLDSAMGGMKLGVVCWVGFSATVGLSAVLFSGKKFATWFIDGGYQLASVIVMGAILGTWR